LGEKVLVRSLIDDLACVQPGLSFEVQTTGYPQLDVIVYELVVSTAQGDKVASLQNSVQNVATA